MKDESLSSKRYKRNISGNDEFVYRDKDVAEAVAELKDKVKDYFLYDEFKVDRVYILGIIDKIFGTFNSSRESDNALGKHPTHEDTSNSKGCGKGIIFYEGNHYRCGEIVLCSECSKKGCGKIIKTKDFEGGGTVYKCGRERLCPKCKEKEKRK